MIQSIDEKSARYLVIKLMFEDKFQEAEKLLSEFTASGLIDRSYTDFYYVILDAIGIDRTEQPTEPRLPVSSGPAEMIFPESAFGSCVQISESYPHNP